MPSKDKGFLVEAAVELVGGQTVRAVDAFRAETPEEAENYAFNVFITGRGMIMYGNQGVVVDAMCAIRVYTLKEIDLAAPENRKWLNSVDLFERFMEEQDARQESDRPFEAATGPGS